MARHGWPRLAVSAMAALDGNPGLALGNAYGSNITNIAVIVGLTAVIAPITVHSQVIRKELPLLLVLTAIAGYREALALRADRPHGWIKLGNALVRAGQPDAAASAFREAIAREEIGAAYNGLGSALSLLERFDEAEDALEMAAQLDMEDANPLMNLALLHERLGHGDEAAHAWERSRARSAAL